MVSLALAGEKELIPSLVEAPDPDATDRKPSYSLETVRRVKKSLGKSDHLYFLIGMDAFKDIAKWYKAEELLRGVRFHRSGADRDIRLPTWPRRFHKS